MKVLAVGNAKGGTGKTVTSCALADSLTRQGKSVCLLDFDPQGSSSVWLGNRTDGEEMVDALEAGDLAAAVVRRPGSFDLIPTGGQLAGYGVRFIEGQRVARETVLKRSIAGLKYDWVVIDCPPSLGSLVVNALAAADGVVIPCECAVLALAGLGQYAEVLEDVRQVAPNLKVAGVIPVKARRTRHSGEAIAMLNEAYGKKVTDPIPDTVAVQDAAAQGLTLHDYGPSRRIADIYDVIAKQIQKEMK